MTGLNFPRSLGSIPYGPATPSRPKEEIEQSFSVMREGAQPLIPGEEKRERVLHIQDVGHNCT